MMPGGGGIPPQGGNYPQYQQQPQQIYSQGGQPQPQGGMMQGPSGNLVPVSHSPMMQQQTQQPMHHRPMNPRMYGVGDARGSMSMSGGKPQQITQAQMQHQRQMQMQHEQQMQAKMQMQNQQQQTSMGNVLRHSAPQNLAPAPQNLPVEQTQIQQMHSGLDPVSKLQTLVHKDLKASIQSLMRAASESIKQRSSGEISTAQSDKLKLNIARHLEQFDFICDQVDMQFSLIGELYKQNEICRKLILANVRNPDEPPNPAQSQCQATIQRSQFNSVAQTQKKFYSDIQRTLNALVTKLAEKPHDNVDVKKAVKRDRPTGEGGRTADLLDPNTPKKPKFDLM